MKLLGDALGLLGTWGLLEDHVVTTSFRRRILSKSKHRASPRQGVPWKNSAANITFPQSHLKLPDSNYDHCDGNKHAVLSPSTIF